MHNHFHAWTIQVCLCFYQALLLNSAAKKMTTAGEMVNLMSVDAHRLMSTMTFISTLWSSPLQIILAFYFLYQTMGVAVLAGVGVLVLLFPLSYVLSKLIAGFQVSVLPPKDGLTDKRNVLLNCTIANVISCIVFNSKLCRIWSKAWATFFLYLEDGETPRYRIVWYAENWRRLQLNIWM